MSFEVQSQKWYLFVEILADQLFLLINSICFHIIFLKMISVYVNTYWYQYC